LRPDFQVWNLTHEYIHYLDGRFNWYGSFSDLPLDAPYSAVWYVEGFAEYMSYSYRQLVYAAAVGQAAGPDTFSMSELYDSEYGTDYARTYQWGYMAVRFMYERHRDQISDLYAISRPGNYDPGYHDWLDAVRNSHDSEFREWVVCFAANNGDTSSCGGPAADRIFGSGFDGDAGPPGGVQECTSSDTSELGNGCKRSNLGVAAANGRIWLHVNVPSGRSNLRLAMSGGDGDADLYVRAGNWPSESEYDFAPLLPGNEETVIVVSPIAGYYYLMLKPSSTAFSGVQVEASWE
jgi:microbial collagenase